MPHLKLSEFEAAQNVVIQPYSAAAEKYFPIKVNE